MAILQRAQEIARREESAQLRLGHVLRGYLFRRPALEHHLLRAAALAEDANSSAISNVHFLEAIIEDKDDSATQILSRHTDLSALLSDIRREVATFDDVEEHS
jgi:ATP-dependent Clp protease ATP-binding subunit ClpA